ncbi:MAG: glutamyl-tRNA reductase [Bacillota bacterium]
MPLVLLGVNHKQAGLELREKLSFMDKEIPRVLEYFLQDDSIRECFILSTCNRTELYTICKGNEALLARFEGYFREVKKQPLENPLPRVLYIREEEEAVRHLFAVACGLDSMVLGETQILGQIKEAYHQCRETGAMGSYLHGLCQKALATGKKVHTLTTLGQHPVSFGYAAVAVAKHLFQSLQNHTLMVIGTGEMAKLTLQNLFVMGAQEVIVVSRHPERAAALAARFQGKALNYTCLTDGLARADVVICATQAPHFIINVERLERLRRPQKEQPLLLIDLAVPRNVDPAVATLEGVYLYNLDDLQYIINENLKIRENEAAKAGSIIDEQVREFSRWYRRQRAIPIITALRRKSEQIRQAKLEQFGVAALSPREQQLVDKLTRSLTDTLLKEPLLAIKDLCLQDDYTTSEKYARQIFRLEQEQLAEGEGVE